MSEVSLLGVGTVLSLERDAWSLIKGLKASNPNEYTSPLFSYPTHERLRSKRGGRGGWKENSVQL